jgi:hypothetical protein
VEIGQNALSAKANRVPVRFDERAQWLSKNNIRKAKAEPVEEKPLTPRARWTKESQEKWHSLYAVIENTGGKSYLKSAQNFRDSLNRDVREMLNKGKAFETIKKSHPAPHRRARFWLNQVTVATIGAEGET